MSTTSEDQLPLRRDLIGIVTAPARHPAAQDEPARDRRQHERPGAQSSPSGSPLLARLISSSSTHRHEGCEAPHGAITRKATRTKTLLGTAGLFCATLELHQKEEMSKRVRDEIKLAVTTLMVIGLWLTQL